MLGSIIIWLLLILSITSIGMIMTMAMTNTEKTVLPEPLVDSVRRQLAAGQFKEAIDATAADDSFFARTAYAGMQQASHGYGDHPRARADGG